MPAEDDIALDEKRVYGEKRDETTAFVASDMGVTQIEVAGDQIGRFSLVHDEPATSIAGADGKLVVGTESDVFVGTGEGFAETNFGGASVVGIDDGTPLAVAPDGTVARLEGDEWVTVGSVTGPRRMDGNLLATRDSVVRVAAGLFDLDAGPTVRDVAAAGPYAATADGLLAYDDGWTRVAGGDCALVTADDERAHAISEDGLLTVQDGDWRVHDLPTDTAIADIAYGESLYAVTADGTVFVYAAPELTPDGQGGWRSRALGVRKVVGLAVP
ncbi:HVO_0234 family beta-propeller protein [Salinibaculum rarum]|uniref:HVO_0234 family beta-propeller protein n=1 Tax=Salinibaculum rarum TaxID=3058903 RepID=UPI00265DE360|nr:hypothetical protein [Salinibaculum sp. KK48]